jgi:hypothetical protein
LLTFHILIWETKPFDWRELCQTDRREAASATCMKWREEYDMLMLHTHRTDSSCTSALRAKVSNTRFVRNIKG